MLFLSTSLNVSYFLWNLPSEAFNRQLNITAKSVKNLPQLLQLLCLENSLATAKILSGYSGKKPMYLSGKQAKETIALKKQFKAVVENFSKDNVNLYGSSILKYYEL